MGERLPNFLHLGPGKSGSTWLHEVLLLHPGVYLTEAKDLYFFSRYYDRGLEWYRGQFRDASDSHDVVAEVCPDYLACPQAPERIRSCLGPEVKLMVTLREPATRAFSSYLYLRKHGLARPSFRETVEASPELVEEGRYATQLERYLQHFDRDSLRVGLFDDLQSDPQAFLDSTTDWLGVPRQQTEPSQLEARLPASKARWLPLAWTAQHAADWVRHHDGAALVGHVKRSSLVQRALYTPLGDRAPALPAEDALFIRERLESEIVGVEREFGIPLRARWGWT